MGAGLAGAGAGAVNGLFGAGGGMVLVPLLTMRSMAEERHSRTDQLLLTSPASIATVVTGKYLAMMTVLLIPVLVPACAPSSSSSTAPPSCWRITARCWPSSCWAASRSPWGC